LLNNSFNKNSIYKKLSYVFIFFYLSCYQLFALSSLVLLKLLDTNVPVFLLYFLFFFLTSLFSFVFITLLSLNVVFFLNLFSLTLFWAHSFYYAGYLFSIPGYFEVSVYRYFLDPELWFRLGLNFLMDRETLSFVMVVTTITLVWYVYSYFRFIDEPLLKRWLICLCLSCAGMCYMYVSTSIVRTFVYYSITELISHYLNAPWMRALSAYKKVCKKFPYNMLKYFILVLLIFFYYNVTMQTETWMLDRDNLCSHYECKLYGYYFLDFMTMVRERDNPRPPI